MAHSDRWNPLGENEDITDIQTSSNVIISGTQKKTGKDDFWPRAEENLLKAFEFYFMENKLEQNTLTVFIKSLQVEILQHLIQCSKDFHKKVLQE